jgi:hypothetical protein
MDCGQPRPAGGLLGLGEQLGDFQIRRCLRAHARQHLDGADRVALAEHRLALQDLRGDRRVIELERDAHLGEHFVEALEREQCLAEHDATLDGRRASEQTKSADLDGLLVLTSRDQ